MPPVQPFSWAINSAASRFGKTDRRLEGQLQLDVTNKLRRICVEFPYWFLRVEPGTAVPLAVPYSSAPTSFKMGRFLDQGWFLTQAGVESYPLFATVMGDNIDGTNDYWAPVEAAQINYVYQFGLDGGMSNELVIADSYKYFSRGMPNTGRRGSSTFTVFPQTFNGFTTLRLNPVPDDTYLMCTSFQLAYPPWIGVGAGMTNWAMFYYPELIQLLVKLQYAEHYHEAQALQIYQRELYGDGGARNRGDLPFPGLLADMKTDTYKRQEQQSQEMANYSSSREAVGRGGFYTRDPGDPYYMDPPG